MKTPYFSIVIPTKNSQNFMDISLKSIMNQSGVEFESIIADNYSSDATVKIAKEMGAKVLEISGNPPQVCRQRNAGANVARGEYLIILDHDMELPEGFLISLKHETLLHPSVDAWYIPERIQASNTFLSKMRTFENEIYRDTPICAVRVIKLDIFRKTNGYDLTLSGGPADWDFDMTLREARAVLRTSGQYLIHHEESLRYRDYVRKKNKYHNGVDSYIKKWIIRNPNLYNSLVKKQFNLYYRLFGVFFTRSKFWYSIAHFHLYIGFLITRFIMFWYY